jgi:Fic family protein
MEGLKHITDLIEEYQSLGLHDVLGHDNFNAIAITHHSTVIEGSTLTETETRLLIEEGITPKGKPLEHSLMARDHYEALQFCLTAADAGSALTENFIRQVNSMVMKNTGSVYNTPLGTVDATKGEYRKGNVSAGGKYFPGYDKVPDLMKNLVQDLQKRLASVSSITDQLQFSFSAHYNLVSIHPFYDGNGRTSRLLMNYIQHKFDLPLGIVYQEDKADYINALNTSREKESIEAFNNFMSDQYGKFLNEQIRAYQNKDIQVNKKGLSGFLLW